MRQFGRLRMLIILLMSIGLLNAQEAAQTPIRLKSGRVPPNQLGMEGDAVSALRFSGGARLDTGFSSRFHFLLQFNGPPGFSERAALEQRGAVVVSYVPDNAWICALPEGFDFSGLDLRYAGRLEAGNKLSPLIPADGEAAMQVLVEFHSDVEPPAMRAIAGAARVEIVEHPDVQPPSMMVRGAAEAIGRLAAHDEVAYILPASELLRSGETVAACLGGSVDGVAAAANLAARFGEGWDGPGLGVAELRYWLGAMAPDLDAAAVRSEIQRALAQWQAVAAVRLSAASAPSMARSIDIAFLSRDHGDGFRFDGRGGVLAHTFYPPPNGEPLAGDMHLDMEEPWRIGVDVDVFSVVLHEVGHALGLGHNDDPNSVMYPYYRRVNGLRPADVTEIRKLYAAAGGDDPPPATPSQPPPAPTPSPTPVTDTIAPALTLNAPPSLTTAASIVLRGVATDNVGVTAVTWQTGGGLSGAATGLPQFSTSPIPLNPGINRVTIRARDAAGNESFRTVSITRR